ncbi:MAG: hypothetical protein AAFV85_15835 [Cyanobacteria bacterium J06634_6]
MSRRSSKRNPKIRATATIWGVATGMLAICIPLVPVAGGGIILPLLVVLGAGGGTVAVWLSPEQARKEELRLAEKVEILEERIITLETICTGLLPSEKQP